MRSRTRSFRRSVIQVAAAFAALPACGTDAHGTGEDIITNPPECENSDAPGCVPSCPDTPPQEAAPCSAEGQHCSYDSCSNAENVSDATCSDGKWELGQASCNPPPPPEAHCPPTEPVPGTPCEVPNEDCWYGTCGDPDGSRSAFCLDGTWEILLNACPLPRPYCPEARPADGSACDHADLECLYEGDCDLEEARCDGETWHVEGPSICNPPELVCPENLPVAGEPCDVGLYCPYGEPEPTYIAECDAGIWTVECADGAPDGCVTPACPEEPPEPGTACGFAEQYCGYDDCGGYPSVEATCEDGLWSVSETSCNPPEIDLPVEE